MEIRKTSTNIRGTWLAGLGWLTMAAACTAQTPVGVSKVTLMTNQAALSADEVSSVAITVTGTHVPDDFAFELAQTEGVWQGLLGSIPVGTERVFRAQALDANNAPLFEGVAENVTISEDSVAIVQIVLQPVDVPDTFNNSAPIIDAIAASSQGVKPGGTIALSVTAHDPDGDGLSYTWTSEAGEFAHPSASATGWTAPPSAGTYELNIRVADPAGLSAELVLEIVVAAHFDSGAANTTVEINTWPEITSITASPTRLEPEESSNISLQVSDNDGDELEFEWSDDCDGEFDDDDVQNPTFTAPDDLPDSETCILTVVVSDSRGGHNTGNLTIHIDEAAAPDFAPVFERTYQASREVDTDDSVALRVRVSDDGDSISFQWSAEDGELDSQSDTTVRTNPELVRRSAITWTAPDDSGEYTITVIATDSAGATTEHEFEVEVD